MLYQSSTAVRKVSHMLVSNPARPYLFAHASLSNVGLHAFYWQTSKMAATAAQMIYLYQHSNGLCNLAEIQVCIIWCPHILQTAMHSSPHVCTVSCFIGAYPTAFIS
jgi:hypothetical protein